jgi:iron complex outermembrane receptor protein
MCARFIQASFHMLAVMLVLLGPVARAHAGHPDQPEQDSLRRLSIEELMRIDVTTATRQPEPVGTTAAAISVVTSDDIRRSGVTTIADALLLADGVHVARFNNGSWSITARGFNQNTANKLLVMVDGRTVYSPLFTGVFWNSLDYVLEDIDRIEVIRGPGATLWGANAVNGVVNIITRHSRDTRGALVSVSAGNEDRAIVEARYGGGAADAVTWRVYGKSAFRDEQRFSTGGPSGDSRRREQAGFRVDGGAAGGTSWMVTGDAFHSRDELPDRAAGEFTDLALQARWSHAFSSAARFDVKSYYRREYRKVPLQLTHRIDVFDLDAQHAVTFAAGHDIVVGATARVNVDATYPSAVIRFTPQDRTYPVFSVFAQDEYEISERVSVTGGVKVEHNAFSGAELQPNARARVLLPARQMLWGAVARAVRRPTRFDDDIEIVGPNGALLVRGSDDFVAESLVASEVGYRLQPGVGLSVDVTVFEHRYDRLRSQEFFGRPPIVVGNTLDGRSRGIELALKMQPATWWRTHLSYTWLDTAIDRAPGSRDISGGVNEMNDPSTLFGLRSSLDLPAAVELDAMVRFVGALPDPAVPAYTELTLRAGRRITSRADIFVVGHDLLHDAHPEFGTSVPRRVEFERGVRAGMTLRF